MLKNNIMCFCYSILWITSAMLYAEPSANNGDTQLSDTSIDKISHTNGSLIHDENVKIGLSGKVEIQEGQFEKGFFLGPDNGGELTAPIWNHRMFAQLGLEAFVGNNFHIIIAPQVYLWSNTYPENMEGDHLGIVFSQWSYVSIADGEGIFSFGDVQKPYLQLAAGVMPFKYDHDAYNLGEYLFRSSPYPNHIETSFDNPFATLAGFRVSSTLFENLHQDLLLTTETDVMPLYDWSLSYLVGYKIPSLVDLGAGINLHHWFPVDGRLTTPEGAQSGGNQYLNANGDTSYYSFKGIELMGRLSFDIKGILPRNISNMMGAEDAKIFGEAAILGVQNYPAYKYENGVLVVDTANNYYGDISKRIPLMAGLNFPTFKFLDVVSIQVEWWKWPYLNSYFSPLNQGEYPVPKMVTTGVTSSDLINGYVKWSVYAKKQVVQGFSIIGQIADDHAFHESYYPQYTSVVETFIKHGDWGWNLKLQYSF